MVNLLIINQKREILTQKILIGILKGFFFPTIKYMFFFSTKSAALEELMDNMKVPLPTPLSWQDQILKSEGKIRGPRKHEVKIVEVRMFA